jgi:predicted HD phosphohydrolase
MADTTFTRMQDATADDYKIIGRHSLEFFARLPERVLDHLRPLELDTGGYAVSRLTHSLQTATRAERDGRDDEYVVCALLHDIGDTLACANHSELAATILQPFVSEENHWIVEHHGVFQGYYFFHHLGLDRNARDRHREHPLRAARYRRRLERAHASIEAGDPRFVASPRVDSYHSIWFELHEDLIRLAGRTRAGEAEAGRAD